MRRVVITSGGGISSSTSKFKPSKKPLSNSYLDVGGELVLSSSSAILREKDLATGSSTGKEYKLPIRNVRSHLPAQYKDIESLEVVCRLRSQRTEIKSIHNKKNQQEYSCKYWITQFYHIALNNEVLECSYDGNKTVESRIYNYELINQNNTEQSGKSDKIVFEYVGKKDEFEKIVADKLCSIIGGSREVFTPEGERVDLLTTDFLIEVKASSDWDDAVGQILKYKLHFPNHELVIFIFADGLDVEIAKKRLIQIIDSFITVTIHVVTSVKEIKALVQRN